jgi:LPXTG-motif cell wall-anchored protein
MKTGKHSHRRTTRKATLISVGGLGLAAAVLLAPVAANADSASGTADSPDLLGNLTGTVGSVLGGLDSAATGAVVPATSAPTDTSALTGAGSGGASALDAAAPVLNSLGNAGLGNGNQANVVIQAPIDISCNAVAVAGVADATCPVVPPTPPGNGGGNTPPCNGGYGTPPGNGGGYTPPGGGYGTPGSGTPGSGTPGSGTPGSTTPGSNTPGTAAGTPTDTRNAGDTQPTAVAATSLPLTGAPSAEIGYAGGGLLILGGGMILMSRRRKVAPVPRGRHGY